MEGVGNLVPPALVDSSVGRLRGERKNGFGGGGEGWGATIERKVCARGTKRIHGEMPIIGWPGFFRPPAPRSFWSPAARPAGSASRVIPPNDQLLHPAHRIRARARAPVNPRPPAAFVGGSTRGQGSRMCVMPSSRAPGVGTVWAIGVCVSVHPPITRAGMCDGIHFMLAHGEKSSARPWNGVGNNDARATIYNIYADERGNGIRCLYTAVDDK